MEESEPKLSPQQLQYPPYPMPGYMTVMDYAKTRGCSDVNVRIAIRKGKIKEGAVRDELNRIHVMKEVADKEWDAARGINDLVQSNRREREKNPEAFYGYDGSSRNRREEDDDEGDSTDPSILEAKRKNEWIKVETNTLILEEKRGKLVDAEKVKSEVFELARMVRSNMLAIPDRLSPKLAAERDERKVHKELVFEIKKALRELQEIIKEGMDDER